jgi:hypothetical protein
MQRISWKLLVGALGASAFVACADITSPANQSAAGRYALQTVNGYTLPYTFGSGNSTVSLQSDFYTLSNDGTYTETTNETVSNGFQYQNVTQNESGRWSQNGNAVSFYPSFNSQGNLNPYTGSLSGGGILSGGLSLTIGVNGVVSVYEMQ